MRPSQPTQLDHFAPLGFGRYVIPRWQGWRARSIRVQSLFQQAIAIQQRFEPLLKFALEQIG